jgi:hypothetical protein
LNELVAWKEKSACLFCLSFPESVASTSPRLLRSQLDATQFTGKNRTYQAWGEAPGPESSPEVDEPDAGGSKAKFESFSASSLLTGSASAAAAGMRV